MAYGTASDSLLGGGWLPAAQRIGGTAQGIASLRSSRTAQGTGLVDNLKEDTPRGILFLMRHNRPGILLAIGGAAVIALAGCSSSDSTTATPTDVTVESPAPGTVSLLSPEEFNAAAAQPGVVLLDVRTPQEFADGHIDGALNVDLNSPSFPQQIAELDPSTTYAVYCRSGNRSAAATAYMLEQGFAAPYELQGGIVAWQGAGLPVS